MAIYQDIAAEIARDIRSGYYRPGDRIYSISELRERYGVSLMTAVRVHQALAKMGVARKVQGNGVFANASVNFDSALSAAENTDIRKVKVFCQKEDRYNFQEEIRTGITMRAATLGLGIEYAFINPHDISLNALNSILPEPHLGYIVISTGPALHLAAGVFLLSSRINCVLIDSIISGSHAVLTDNFDGVNQLVAHLLKQGYQHLVFADKFKSTLGMVNASERRLAFDLRAARGDFESRVIDSGRFQDLTELFAQVGSKSAFLFPQDAPALRFRSLLIEDGVRQLPGLTGFDDYAGGQKELAALTTIQLNRRELGEKAVEVLFKPMKTPEIVRIKGTLLVRETTKEKIA